MGGEEGGTLGVGGRWDGEGCVGEVGMGRRKETIFRKQMFKTNEWVCVCVCKQISKTKTDKSL